MTINKTKADNIITLALEGRLDTTTAPELDKEIDVVIEETADLIFDFKDLEYISSAGLRVLLKAQKAMSAKGTMKLINVNDSIMEVFFFFFFVDILTIE